MSVETPNTDPSLIQEQSLSAASQDMLVDGRHMSMFEIPPSPERRSYINNDRLLTDNTEGFARLVTGGIDALKDGETVTFATTNSITLDDPWATIVRTVTRNGDSFSISKIEPTDTKLVDKSPEDCEAQLPIEVTNEQARKFCRGV